MDLPNELKAALDAALAGVPAASVSRSVDELSQRYRDRAARNHQIRSDRDVTAYAAYRMPATYASAVGSFSAVAERVPDWRPRSVLDVGAGPGTAAWASVSVWPEIESVTLLERDDRMIAFGRSLAAESFSPALSGALWQRFELGKARPAGSYDLVIGAYVVGELDPVLTSHIVKDLWARSNGVLVLIEPGTPAGFSVIRSLRRSLLNEGGAVLAPCPHGEECPLAGGDWCHFSQRLARSRLHRQVKGAGRGYEDEKYSYVALTRQSVSEGGARVLRHPQIRPGQVRLELCARQGLESAVVTRKDLAAYRAARDLRWGSWIETPSFPRIGVPSAPRGAAHSAERRA